MDQTEKKILPPYLSFTTLTNFVDGLAVNMPNRIDKSLMGTMSGAAQSALISALDYLGLKEGDKPSALLIELAAAPKGDEQAKVWDNVIRGAYPYLFHGFDLKTATAGQLEERFKAQGASGSTITKCVGFFIAACTAAGIPLSPFFKKVKARAPRSRGSKRATKAEKRDIHADEVSTSANPPAPSKLPKVIQAWIDEMPPEGQEWSRDDFDSWLNLFAGSIERLYKIPK